MIKRRLRWLNRKQRGFTLVELLIGITIMAIIGAGATATIIQVLKGSSRSNDRMTAITNVQNVANWVARDAQMADNVSPASDFPLTLTWHDALIDTPHNAVYVYSPADRTIARSYDGGAATVIGRYLSAASQTYNSGNNTITLTLTATMPTATETRTYQIQPRPAARH